MWIISLHFVFIVNHRFAYVSVLRSNQLLWKLASVITTGITLFPTHSQPFLWILVLGIFCFEQYFTHTHTHVFRHNLSDIASLQNQTTNIYTYLTAKIIDWTDSPYKKLVCSAGKSASQHLQTGADLQVYMYHQGTYICNPARNCKLTSRFIWSDLPYSSSCMQMLTICHLSKLVYSLKSSCLECKIYNNIFERNFIHIWKSNIFNFWIP